MTQPNSEAVWEKTIDALVSNTESLGKLKGQIELFHHDMQHSNASIDKQKEILNT